MFSGGVRLTDRWRWQHIRRRVDREAWESDPGPSRKTGTDTKRIAPSGTAIGRETGKVIGERDDNGEHLCFLQVPTTDEIAVPDSIHPGSTHFNTANFNITLLKIVTAGKTSYSLRSEEECASEKSWEREKKTPGRRKKSRRLLIL